MVPLVYYVSLLLSFNRFIQSIRKQTNKQIKVYFYFIYPYIFIYLKKYILFITNHLFALYASNFNIIFTYLLAI